MAKQVGLIGYGVAGRILHAPLLTLAGFEIAGVVTRDDARRSAVAQDFPKARICSDLTELLSLPLDLVVVASANNVHVEHARAAILAKIPVVVDKPVAPNYQEVSELFDFALQHQVPITVFYNRLWDSDFLALQRHRNLIDPIFRFESRFERWRPDINPAAWRENTPESKGGGVLIDLHSHLVAGALALFGPAQVAHSSARSIRTGSNDDAHLILEHASGVLSVLSASAIAAAPGPRVRALGRNGALVVEDIDFQENSLRAGRFEARASKIHLHRGDSIEELDPVAGEWPNFYHGVARALDGKGELPVTKEFALSVARILEDAWIQNRS